MHSTWCPKSARLSGESHRHGVSKRLGNRYTLATSVASRTSRSSAREPPHVPKLVGQPRRTIGRAATLRSATSAAYNTSSDGNPESNMFAPMREFSVDEFTLSRLIAQIRLSKKTQEVGNVENPFSLPSLVDTTPSNQPAVNVYTATYAPTDNAFFEPLPVILKEYPGSAQELARKELGIYVHLLSDGFLSPFQYPGTPMAEPPLAPMLGFFCSVSVSKAKAGLGEESSEGLVLGGASGVNEADLAVWIVERRDDLPPRTLQGFPEASPWNPPPPPGGGGGGGLLSRAVSLVGRWEEERAAKALAEARAQRSRFLRAAMQRSLWAVGFCHTRGVIHQSLSGGSLLLTSYEVEEAGALGVRLTNFGTAAELGGAVGGGDESISSEVVRAALAAQMDFRSYLQSEDLCALGWALMELVFSAFAMGGPSEETAAPALRRVVRDLFAFDMPRVREYYAAEEDCADVVGFLDHADGAGWELLAAMFSRRASPQSLLENRFFSELPPLIPPLSQTS